MAWQMNEGGVTAQCDGGELTLSQPYILSGPGVDPVAVAAHPTDYLGGISGNEPLPGFNSTHPSDPRLKLDAYAVNSDGAIKTVSALYSSSRRFTFPTPNVVPISGYRWRVTFETQTVEVPWTSLVKQLVAAGEYRDAYLFLNQKMFEKVVRISINCRIKEANIGNTIDVIAEQASTIHFIGGRHYLFEPSDITDAEDRVDYRAEFSWVRPLGIPFIEADDLPADTYFPNVFSKIAGVPQEPWTKPPFHEVILKPWPTDPSALPEFRSILNRKVNPTGYASILALLP